MKSKLWLNFIAVNQLNTTARSDSAGWAIISRARWNIDPVHEHLSLSLPLVQKSPQCTAKGDAPRGETPREKERITCAPKFAGTPPSITVIYRLFDVSEASWKHAEKYHADFLIQGFSNSASKKIEQFFQRAFSNFERIYKLY